MIWIGDGPEPSGGSRNRNTEARHHQAQPCPDLAALVDVENKTPRHATVSSVTDCLNIRLAWPDSNDHNGHREVAPISH